MPYTVKQLADLAKVSVRTLHHYDQIGLLKPARIETNGYRYYGEGELLRLQQILFFKELEFGLDDIKRILSSPAFNMTEALRDQRRLIELKKNRLGKLVKTIDQTLKKMNHENSMTDQELFNDFDMTEMKQYQKEARARWGHTEAWQQSQERTKGWTKKDYAKLKADADTWMKNFVRQMHHGPKSETIQQLIAQHYNNLRTFYEPNLEMYRGLAAMYVTDKRFEAYYEKYAPGLARFMHDAMIFYADTQKSQP